jgi:hypothetical protein
LGFNENTKEEMVSFARDYLTKNIEVIFKNEINFLIEELQTKFVGLSEEQIKTTSIPLLSKEA